MKSSEVLTDISNYIIENYGNECGYKFLNKVKGINPIYRRKRIRYMFYFDGGMIDFVSRKSNGKCRSICLYDD